MESAQPDPAVESVTVVAPAPAAFPIVTIALLLALIGVFALEQIFALDTPTGELVPSVRTLVSMGGLYWPSVVDDHEWYRLFTSAFLHGGVSHLVLNGIALFMAGFVLETTLGRAWLISLFAAGAAGGSLLSLALNPHENVSIGASGAIMGLIAAALLASFRIAGEQDRGQVQGQLLRILVPSLLPLATTRTGHSIDFASHVGGAVVGFAMGGALLATWPRTSPRPRFRAIAAALALASACVFGYGGYESMGVYNSMALDAELMPNESRPKTNEEALAQLKTLQARYPRDPRVHFYAAIGAFDEKAYDKAEAELRAGLSERELLTSKFGPGLERALRSLLAHTLLAAGRTADARTEARPLCSGEKDEPAQEVQDLCSAQSETASTGG